jgi:hypothetical protein
VTHIYHDALDGFDARQIWHDGCKECEQRGRSVPQSIGLLDDARLARAIERERAWNDDLFGLTGPISNAERPLLEWLYQWRLVNQRAKRLKVSSAA